jgi:geranylgeranyl pyrophosphate synthase
MQQILQSYLDKYVDNKQIKTILEYALFPTGKLFRANLVQAVAKDLGIRNQDHIHSLMSSIEFHHCYTLIHDDLPAMDDDDTRRGRPSTHIKFGEANAILAGDALLSLSYQVLSELPERYLAVIISTYGNKVGSNGLILGQYLDLEEKQKSLEEIIQIHVLKTSRLIELSLVLPAIISGHSSSDQLNQLGHSLGIVFQLTDDLQELTDDLSEHELSINPFVLHSPTKVWQQLRSHIENIETFFEENSQFLELQNYLKPFIDKRISDIRSNSKKIYEKIDFDISENW